MNPLSGDGAGDAVLIIEDNAVNMELAADVLEAAGHRVLRAPDAEQGMALAAAEQPAVILMDVSLPGMDGLTATARLKEDPATRSIPVVALTAHAMSGDREKALAAGCVGYIAKPLDTRLLPRLVQEFIDRGPL